MATIIKAFVSIASQTDNTDGQTSVIGELTSSALTYAVDKGDYAKTAFPDYRLVVFQSTRNNVKSLVSDFVIDNIFAITQRIQTVFDGSVSGSTFLGVQFPSLTEIEAGATVVQRGRNWLTYFKATLLDDNEETALEIYYSSDVFVNMSDLAETRIVPPVNPITSLYGSYAIAKAAVDRVTYPMQVAAKETVRNGANYTSEVPFELIWNDPTDSTKQITTIWTALCFGKNAARPENIQIAIRNYLVNESPYTLTDWQKYFPDILTVENMTFIPIWDNVALTAGPGLDSVYSPIVNAPKVNALVRKFLPARTVEEIRDQGEVFTHIWRGIQTYVIAGSANPDESNMFSTAYPDYCVTTFNDQNASRVSAKTRQLIETLELLFPIALVFTPGNNLPVGISQIVSNDMIYLEKNIAGISCRVLTYYSFSQ